MIISSIHQLTVLDKIRLLMRLKDSSKSISKDCFISHTSPLYKNKLIRIVESLDKTQLANNSIIYYKANNLGIYIWMIVTN
jgi:hypothetical protein